MLSAFFFTYYAINSLNTHSEGASHVPDPGLSAGYVLANQKDMVAVPIALNIWQERLHCQMKELGAGHQGGWALGCCSHKFALLLWPCLSLFPPP